MIRITEEYRIIPSRGNSLRHFCSNKERGHWNKYGAPAATGFSKCWSCNKPTPKKILFIYNLWKFHND